MASVRLFVHGGVAGRPLPRRARLDEAIRRGLTARAALDAVELATLMLEDDPELNAGTGAVLNRAGGIELDAGICDGVGTRYGGVAGVVVKNPISLARRVMDTTPHVLLAGPGADALGSDMDRVVVTPKQQRRWEEAVANGRLTDQAFGDPASVDTVGAIALADDGSLAAASSTGGVFGKLPGRVGDAAILGAGLFASAHAAVVGTGVGELFLRSLAAFRVAALIEAGAHPQSACAEIIQRVASSDRRPVGLLAIDVAGRVGAAFRGAALQVEGPEGPIEPERL